MGALDDRFAQLVVRENAVRELELKLKGGGGTSGGVTDEWKADVERRLGELASEFKWLRGLFLGGCAAGAAAIGGLYLYIDAKVANVDAKLSPMATTIARIEGKIDAAAEARRADESTPPAAR